jgi:hypothetical protein
MHPDKRAAELRAAGTHQRSRLDWHVRSTDIHASRNCDGADSKRGNKQLFHFAPRTVTVSSGFVAARDFLTLATTKTLEQTNRCFHRMALSLKR